MNGNVKTGLRAGMTGREGTESMKIRNSRGGSQRENRCRPIGWHCFSHEFPAAGRGGYRRLREA